MIPFNKTYLTGKKTLSIFSYDKLKSLKNKDKFLLIILFNVLFFSLLAYWLPFYFEANDDTFMCLIASGVYSGAPDAHLIFINYLYGLVLTFFYGTFTGVEWYTLFFCIIHVVSLSIIVFQFIKINKPVLVKSIFIVLLYVIELRIILLFQFTTTAAIVAFAGTLLLFETKKIYKFCSVFLFLIAVLVRFDAAMLSVLLMLPIFGYEVFSDKRKIAGILIPAAICICGAFILQIINNQIYNTNKEWSEYREYNAVRGKINDNPNAPNIMNNLPDGISKNDYQLLLGCFADGQVINLSKIKELNDLIQKTPFTKKVKNIYPYLRRYAIILGLIVVLFGFCFWEGKQNKSKIYFLFYLLFFLGVLTYISINGNLRYRVFITALLPVIFSLYTNTPLFPNKKIKIGYVGMASILSLYLFISFYNRREVGNEYKKTLVEEQHAVMKEIQGTNKNVVPIAEDLTFELFCSPFDISKTFSEFSLLRFDWLTKAPFNKGRLDSYASLADANTCIFVSREKADWYIPKIQKALIEHYGLNTKKVVKFENRGYLLIQLEKDNTYDTFQ